MTVNMKKTVLAALLLSGLVCCRSKIKEEKRENGEKGGAINTQLNLYLDSLKSENSLKITMGGEPVTIVGKETKVGDTLKTVPLTVNPQLKDKDILADKAVKVIYTAPSLDTKVCSIQTRILNDTAVKYTHVKFYSVTIDTPFAQERFCTGNEIHNLIPVSDYKYHQFGIQNGLFIKEKGLLTRALMIVDENNVVKYIEYVKEQADEADVEKAIRFLEEKILKK